MYINIDNLLKSPRPDALPLLLVLKHAPNKDVSTHVAMFSPDDEGLQELLNEGYIKYIKGKKGDNALQRLRLDKKGTKYLNELDEPMVEEQDVKIFDWLSGIYKSKDKKIGNGKKTKRLIASFREKSGIEKNHLAYLCNAFINDEAQQEWSFMLEYVFWKPKNMFQTKFVLEDSRLWRYYNENKEYFDKQFKQIK